MKSLAPLLLLIAFLPAPVWGTGLPTCGVASLATYESYGDNGCSLGTAFVFKDFEYILNVSINANTVTASNITVTPVLNGNQPDFTFTANWGVDGTALLGTGTLNAVLGFRGVSSDDVFSAFDSVQLITVGSNGSGLATNLVTEEDCVGGLLTGALCSVGGGTTANIGASILGINLGANAAVSFTPSTSIDVLKTISLVSVLGSDNLTSIGQDLGTNSAGAPTPEPVTMSMFVGGIAALGLGRFLQRRRLTRRVD
jgi:hypothetical protein